MHTVSKPHNASAECKECQLFQFCFQNDEPSLLIVDQLILEAHSEMPLFIGSDSKSIYAIHSGVLKYFDVDPAGQEFIYQFYLPGEVLGFEHLFSNPARGFVKALTSSRLCKIPLRNLEKLISTNHSYMRRLMQIATQRYSYCYYLNIPDVLRKIAFFLIELSGRLKRTHFTVVMSRVEIGSYLGITGETVSRTLSRLHSGRVIEVSGKEIYIHSIPDLQCIAESGELPKSIADTRSKDPRVNFCSSG